MPRQRRMAQVEVEENPNSHGLAMRVFPAWSSPRPVFQMRMDTADAADVLHWVTGWSSEGGGTPCPALCVTVEDSGSSETVLSYLVYGGDWGVRFRPVGVDEAWSLASPRQFGEPCLLLGKDPVLAWLDEQ